MKYWSIKWTHNVFGIVVYSWGMYFGMGKYDLRIEYKRKKRLRQLEFLLRKGTVLFLKNYTEHRYSISDIRDYPNRIQGGD